MADNNNSNQGSDAGGNGAQGESFGEPVVREAQTENQETVSTDNAANADNTGDQGTETQNTETQDAGTEGDQGDQTDQTQTDDANADKTDKGTKLDEDPLSRANQLRANAERDAKDLAGLLNDPKALALFMEKEHGIKIPVPTEGEATQTQTEPDFKEYTAADLENLDDVAGVINGLQKALSESKKSNTTEIKQLRDQVNGLLLGGKAQALYTKASEEVSALNKEPELDPTNPDYIEGLDKEIAVEYHRLDFDKETGFYKGQQSIKEIGDRMISIARKSRQKGSERAQTVVKDKTKGQIRTSPTADDGKGTEESDPASSIAKGIAGRNFVT